MKTNPSSKFFQSSVVALAIVIASGFSVRQAQAGYIVTLEQVGADVVATGSGAIDLNGLTSASSGGGVAGINPGGGVILTGPPMGSSTAFYIGFTGPKSFGPVVGESRLADSGSGDFVGISNLSSFMDIVVPAGYMSGAPLSDSMTFNNVSFGSIGLEVTPGTYVWTWGADGVNQNFTLDIVPPAGVPDSGSTLGLLLLALSGLFGAARFHFFGLA